MKTYLVTFEIRDGDNEYEQKGLISINGEPEDEAFISEEYGDVPYCSLNDAWDLGYGNGYPLATVSSWTEVKAEHVEILKRYL